MRIIEKIEIKHFRSFDGGVGQPKVEILDIKDLNIFSGANDSGKSNILRALNLFFNDEIAPGIPFNLSRDLSKVLKDRSDLTFGNKQKNKLEARQRDLLVKIKIHFCNEKKDGILKEKFWVEKTWDKSGLKQPYVSNAGKDDRDQHRAKAQLTLFLDKIQFEYIPAVKDRDYFSLLFKKLQDHLFEIQEDFERKNKKKFKKLQSEVTALTNEELDVDTAATVKLTGGSNKFKMQSEKLNELLKQETQSLFEEFKSSTNIDAKFNVPDTLVDFFRTLRVDTGNDVSLFDRGDGVQARFIPTILNEISRDTNQKTIWGFEEPENSYEPLRCFEL
ncbi:MAG: AAA family ATPase, partial [Candidatus Omnitrophota bacterium]|nr:AAA family ATPase [Candidatus Omnitrophota bacterium]